MYSLDACYKKCCDNSKIAVQYTRDSFFLGTEDLFYKDRKQ